MTQAPWQPASDPLDRGEADPALRARLASAYEGSEAYARALASLCTARLILPTVDAPEDAEPGLSKTDEHDHEHTAPQDVTPAGSHPARAALLLRSASGEKGVVVFTGYDALRAWRADAHPVRCTLDDVAATVAETGASTIVIDVAGPHQLVIEAPVVAELARGHRLAELPDGTFAWVWLDDSRGA